MNIVSSLLVVALAALVHASFQLSVSVLTLLSGHAIGAQSKRSRILRMTTSYVIGAGVMTLLLLSFAALIFANLFGHHAPNIVWQIACVFIALVGVLVWIFYYRRHSAGTLLWVPRSLARYLADRTKVTKDSAESFGLGLTTVFAEIIFIAAPIIISGLALAQLPAGYQILGLLIYTVISLFSLGVVWGLVGSGHSLSVIQKWRESNKGFLQFAGGGGLIVLSFFVLVYQVFGANIA